MTHYPEKTCTIDRLVRQERLIEAMISGKKTQQRRNGVYAYPGEIFEVKGVQFKITEVAQQYLRDMTDIDAQAEGFANLETYQSTIVKMHPGMVWDGNGVVWVHTFEQNS